MKRREFLKKSTHAISAVTFAAVSGSSITNLFANNKNMMSNFSFELITDKPEEALKLSQEFFKKNSFESSVIKYSEYQLSGAMTGDIVFVNEGKLINYKNGSNKINKDIRAIAENLSIPKKIVNPYRLRFQVLENHSKAGKFLVFHKNILIHSVKSDVKNLNLNIKGSKGDLIINISNNNAAVVSSSCNHKTCVNSGKITYSGESIVCIPNEILILCE